MYCSTILALGHHICRILSRPELCQVRHYRPKHPRPKTPSADSRQVVATGFGTLDPSDVNSNTAVQILLHRGPERYESLNQLPSAICFTAVDKTTCCIY